MKVRVTKKNIEKGIKFAPYFCPIALALKEKFPNTTVVVGVGGCSIDESFYLLPEEAMNFITKFDTDSPVSPITFEIKDKE